MIYVVKYGSAGEADYVGRERPIPEGIPDFPEGHAGAQRFTERSPSPVAYFADHLFCVIQLQQGFRDAEAEGGDLQL